MNRLRLLARCESSSWPRNTAITKPMMVGTRTQNAGRRSSKFQYQTACGTRMAMPYAATTPIHGRASATSEIDESKARKKRRPMFRSPHGSQALVFIHDPVAVVSEVVMVAHVAERGVGNPACAFGMAHQLFDACGITLRVAGGDEKAGAAVFDHLGNSRGGSRQHDGARCLRFENGERQSFAGRRQQQHVGGAQ